MRNPISLTWMSALIVGVIACSGNPTSAATRTFVANVVPSGGSAGVSTGSSITLTFNRSMELGMEQFAALHEGSVRGAAVQGSWMWSEDRTQLTFTPAAPLQAQAVYVLHLGGGLVDGSGIPIDFQSCLHQMYRMTFTFTTT